MSEWVGDGKPNQIVIRYKDPIELIAYQLVDPIIQFGWKDDIKYEYVEVRNYRNEKVFSDLMATDWAKNTQDAIRNGNTNQDILLPIILYTDGVAL